ncbi:MAG: PAS domain S-box protein, partial [Candidatus Omnitrophota bacterium]
MNERSVLILDDDKEFLSEAQDILASNGYNVLTAQTGKEARRIVKEAKPAVALVDKKLPDVDGQDLIKRFKKVSKNTAVIVVTAYGNMESSIESFRDGVVDYLIKPVSFDEILLRVEDAIKMKKEKKKSLAHYRTVLTKQMRRLSFITSNIPEKLFMKDKNSVYIFCNDNFAKDLNLKPSEIIGKTDKDLFSKSLADKFYSEDKRVIRLGRPEERDYAFTKEGKRISLHSVKTPIIDLQGKPVGLMGLYWEITDIKKTREALVRNEKKYKALINIIPEIVYLASFPGGEPIYVNGKIADILGFNQIEWLGDKELWYRQVYPDDLQKFKSEREKALLKKGIFECEYRMLHKDKKAVRWFRDIGALIKDEKGKTVINGIMVDITETKIRQQENEKLSESIKYISEGVIFIDTNTVITYANKAAFSILGFKKNELLSRHISVFMSEINPPLLRAEIEKHFRKKESWRGELICQRKDTTTFPSFFLLDPLKDEAGKLKGAICIISDVSQRRLLEDELRRYTHHLEEIVEQRTRALGVACKDLEQANVKLHRYDELKSEFVANVAHELVNPLNTVRQGIEIFSKGVVG